MGIEWLLGKTIRNIEVLKKEEGYPDDKIVFSTGGEALTMFREKEGSCEFYIEGVVGKLNKLLNSPITIAEEITEEGQTDYDDNIVWTFYKVGTCNGYVTIWWNGSCDGSYSKTPKFKVCKEEN